MKQMLQNITAGQPAILSRPVLFTTLANLSAMLPHMLVVAAMYYLFAPFVQDGAELQQSALWWLCGGLCVALLLQYLLEMIAYHYQFRSAYGASADGRRRLAEHMRKVPLSYLHKQDSGNLSNMMTGDFTMVEYGVSHLASQLLGAITMPIIALTALMFIDWRLAITLMITMPLTILIMVVATGLMKRLGAAQQEARLTALNRLQQYLLGIRVIKANNMTGNRFKQLDHAFHELMKRSIRVEGVLGPIVLGAAGIMRTGLTLIIVVGTYYIMNGTLDLLVFAAFLIIGTRIYDPLVAALVNYAEFRFFEQAGGRVRGLLEELIVAGDRQPKDDYTISFHDVCFSYNEQNVLIDLNLTFQPNSFTAIVGPSGSGKSTLLRMIARFYDPQQGVIKLGQDDMSILQPDAVMEKMTMVFQEVYLFQDTVAANIRFGRRDATMDEIVDAAKAANCHSFIMQLPQGYDTLVGEGGNTLSGGEKQRISIARALLKNAPIVLLDEATASLDASNEAVVGEAINKLITGRTVIAVAHRLQTIRHADQIIVMEEGRVHEQGSHEQLLANEGLYRHMWRLQQNSKAWHVRQDV